MFTRRRQDQSNRQAKQLMCTARYCSDVSSVYFYQLKRIIEGVEKNHNIGVCLDTCHVYDGGYDIVNKLDEVLNEFEEVIGLSRLRAIHLNDSKNPFESHKDRQIGRAHV